MMTRLLDWVSCLVLARFSVCVLTASLSVPWYNEADHYWNMNRIFYRVLRDTPLRQGGNRWHAFVKGASEVTSSPPNLGIRLHGSYSWIDLGLHYNSCFVDVAVCSSGLSIAFWVKGYERGTHQDMLVFGKSNGGIRVLKRKDGILEARVSSMAMNKTWVVSSVGKVIEPWAWHHVGISWNVPVGLTMYLNAARLMTNSSTIPLHQAAITPPSWSMYIGKNVDIAVDELVLWSHVVSNDTITKAFTFKTGIPASNAGCRPGWIAYRQFCYGSFNTTKSWDSAHRSCQTYSSGLLSILSVQEDDFIRNRMPGATPCTHLGLKGRQGAFDWTDGSVWGYSRLGEQGNISDSDQCVYRNVTDGLWYASDCKGKCGYVCKTYRAGVFRNAGFQCHARQLHRGISGYRLSVVAVQSQVECAIECLIYGIGCRSYNYQRYDKHLGYSEEFSQHLCELNGSRNHVYLVDMDGYQYCERK